MRNNNFILGVILVNLVLGSLHAEPLTFSSAYDLALKNSNAIKSNVYMSEADEEKINQEKSHLYPKIDLSGYYKKSEYVSNPGSSGGDKRTTRQGLYNYSVSLQQSIYDASIYSRINTQKARSEYSKSGVELKKEELAHEVFSSYLNLLKSRNRIKLNESYILFNEAKLKELTKKYELHLINKMDLLEVQVDYDSAKIDLNRERKLYDVYDLKLKQLIGTVEYELPFIDTDKPVLDMINIMKETVGTDKKSLKIKQAQIAVDISEGEVDIASDGHLPTLSLRGSYAKYETDDPNIEAAYDSTKYIMLNIDIPIYTGGYTSSRIATTELMYKAAQEDLIDIQKKVKVEYDESLALFETSAESIVMYKNALKSSELFVESIDQGYKYGLKSITDLQDAKVKYYEVRYKYIENIYDLVDSYIRLLIVTNNFDNIDILDRLVE